MRNVVYGANGSDRRNRERSSLASSAAYASPTSTMVCSGMLKETISRSGLPTLRLAAAFLLLAAVAGPRTATAQRAELERILRRQVLANGLEVVAVESHGVPLVTIEVDVRNGSFTQPPEYAGLAHMYEHMFFRANSKFPHPEAFVDRAGDLGA